MILEIKNQIKVTNIWQNTKFSDLLSKIHYQSEHKIHLYYMMVYILFDNRFFESKSENLIFYQIFVIFIWFFNSNIMCKLLVILFVIKLYARNSVFKWYRLSGTGIHLATLLVEVGDLEVVHCYKLYVLGQDVTEF